MPRECRIGERSTVKMILEIYSRLPDVVEETDMVEKSAFQTARDVFQMIRERPSGVRLT